MRRLLIAGLFVVLTAVLGTTAVHRHALGETKTECTVCTFAQQGVTPASPQAPALRPVEMPLRLELCTKSVHFADGRQIYRSAPKISPPTDNA